MEETEDQKYRRWLKGRYYSAPDAGQALAWFVEMSSGQIGLGVNVEEMALPSSTGNQGKGTQIDDITDHLYTLTDTIGSASIADNSLDIWRRSRVWGWKPEKIARELDAQPGKVSSWIADADRAIERSLAKRGLL